MINLTHSACGRISTRCPAGCNHRIFERIFQRDFFVLGSNSLVELRRLLENVFAEPGLQGVSQIGGMSRRNSLDIWLANSRWATHPLTKGDTNPGPNRFRPFLRARSAKETSNAARMRAGSWDGL